MNEINGTDLRIWINGVKMADATSHTLSIAMKTRPTSNKDSGKYDTEAAGRFTITASADALKVYGNFEAILSAMINQLPVTVDFGQKSADPLNTLDESKFYASGDFLIVGFDDAAPDGETASYSIKLNHNSGFTLSLDTMILLVNITSVDSDNAQDNGLAAATVRGGIAPYTYSWDSTPAQTKPIATDLAPGTYIVTVTDSSSNEGTATVVIAELPA
jgi:hypothetical protein